LAQRLQAVPDIELVTQPILSLFTFRFCPAGANPEAATLDLITQINNDGRIYLTQTRVDDRFVIRFQAGQFDCTQADINTAYDVITEIADKIRKG
jgi:aromatic-L-amino-acid decarboxylase